ncbi:MAG: hypothetical protein LC775_10685 [Acidobacteria bacterium]|nr:hypothetical protein [Acidobacteriota bacterium]
MDTQGEVTPEGPWLLHVPFVAAPELRFTEEEAVETAANSTVHILPDTAPYSRLVIKELTSINQARQRFSDLRRAMLATSLTIGCGIRIKDDLAVFEDDTARLPSEVDQPFICRKARSLARLVFKLESRI